MSPRHKIGANNSVFERLDRYCLDRGEPIANAGSPRWIRTDAKTRDFLTNARLVQKLSLSPSLQIARFDHKTRSFFVTSGFEISEAPEGLESEELNGARLTTFLSDMVIRPLARPIGIKQIVEYSDKTQPDYDGHDCEQMASLFPPIQIFSSPLVEGEESGGVFFLLCMCDRRRTDHWIDDGLAGALCRLSTASAIAIPYDLLCRAVLDFDPEGLFLALYRSLEALYARERTVALSRELGISGDWVQIAQTLEEHLGWYPKEATSLEVLLKGIEASELEKLIDAFGELTSGETNFPALASRRIYALRNGLVHFRPFHRRLKRETINWCRLCESMANLVTDCYHTSVTNL